MDPGLSQGFPNLCVYRHVLPHGAASPEREGLQKEGVEPPSTPPSPSLHPTHGFREVRTGWHNTGRQGKLCLVLSAELEQFWSSQKHLQFINTHFVSKEFKVYPKVRWQQNVEPRSKFWISKGKSQMDT